MSNTKPRNTYKLDLDETDPVKPKKELFNYPQFEGEDLTYLCGHSLGIQPKSARDEVQNVMDQWSKMAVKGHFAGDPWISYGLKLDSQMSKLVGAKDGEVTIMNTLTVNLHLMLTSFYQPSGERVKILIEEKAFPSDIYAIRSHLASRGFGDEAIVIWPQNADTGLLEMADLKYILEDQGDQITTILVGGINYYNGQQLPMSEIVALGHAFNILVGFDLAHAAGNVALELHDWGVDFAVWCTYKYLNGGPGSAGAIYINERFFDEELNRLEGWWGNSIDNRFEMLPEFTASQGVLAWHLSTPTVLALAPLRASLNIFHEIGMEALVIKSQRLTNYLIDQLKSLDCPDFAILTPEEPRHRGTMISLKFSRYGERSFKYLEDNGVVVDWRRPNVIRVAPMPLYNDYQDVYKFVRILEAASTHPN